MKGQKQAVVELVQKYMPNFVIYQDIALIWLSSNDLEHLKAEIGEMMIAGEVAYSKNRHNEAEVHAYARSMVMNHMKKARELNGNQVYGKTPGAVEAEKRNDKLSTVNMDLLPEDLKTYVKSIV